MVHTKELIIQEKKERKQSQYVLDNEIQSEFQVTWKAHDLIQDVWLWI